MNLLQNGSKAIIATYLFAVLLLLTACPGQNDWEYDNLPGDYSITKLNSQDVSFCSKDGQRLIDRYITAFCYNSQFIGLQRVPINTPYNELFDSKIWDDSKPEYYLIDTATDAIYGPWSVDNYYKEIEKYGISEMCEWIATAPLHQPNN